MEGECSVELDVVGSIPIMTVLAKAEEKVFTEYRPTKITYYDDEYRFGRRGEAVPQLESSKAKDVAQSLKDEIDVV